MLPWRCGTVWRHSRRGLFGTPGAVLTRPHLVLLGGWLLPEGQHANSRSLNGVSCAVQRERSSSESSSTPLPPSHTPPRLSLVLANSWVCADWISQFGPSTMP